MLESDPDQSRPDAAAPSVIFVFTHATLTRMWDRAAARLAGQGVRLRVVSQMRTQDWERFAGETAAADAVYLELTRHFPSFDRLLDAARQAGHAVPAGIETEAAWDGAIDRDAQLAVAAYLKAGTEDDLANAALWLLHRAGRRREAPAPPGEPVLAGIYHPDSPDSTCIWRDSAAYLAWADGRQPPAAGTRPAVALTFDRGSWLNGELAAVDAAIRYLEAAGLAPVPMFCDWETPAAFGAPEHPLYRLTRQCGDRLAAIWNAIVIHRRDESGPGGPFAAHDVPVFQLVRHWTASAAEWRLDAQGLNPMGLAFGVARPEMLGCIDPTVTACSLRTEEDADDRRRVEPLDDQLARLAGRTRAWVRLRRTPNAEKRVALMLHNPPCKSLEATIGNASGLDALHSAVDLLRRLRAEGYTVDGIPADGRGLLDLILARKAISEFRWTSVDEIVAKGGVLAEIDEAAFRADFDRLPEALRQAVDDAWGVFPGKSMVHHPEGPRPTLVVTGLAFGNVFVMTDPKRGCWGPRCDGEVCRILHDPAIAPSHHWLGTYAWLRRHVDALVMMGTDGPLEFLPGKRAGLSETCFPNVSLGDLPVVYPYLMSVTGEGLIAKRRGRAVLVDHLSAPVARADALGNRWDAIEEVHRQYLAASPGARRQALRETLCAEMAGLGLPPAEDDAAFERAVAELPRRIEALRRRVLSVGLHVLGRAPAGADADRYVDEARRGGMDAAGEAALREGLAACGGEIDAVLRALAGRFVAPGPSGHLSRGRTEVLPTGRNFYGIDLSCIPTPAAQEVGARMGGKLLRAYLADEGRFPGTIGITLWSTDAFQSDGELAAQILWLMGCAPRRAANGRITGVEALPPEALTLEDGGRVLERPRIDVVVQMSSVVRDLLPNIYALFDQAVAAVTELDEPDARNFIRAHVRARMAELRGTLADHDDAALRRLASYRCFSSGDGGYGGGVGLALDASAWEDDADLAEALINTSGTAYGADGRPAAAPAARQMGEYAHLLRRMEVSYQRASSPETDLLSGSCYLDVQGGTAAARRGLGGGGMRLYWGDTQTDAEGEVRALADEVAQGLAVTLLNPEWLATARAQGYAGASGVSNRVNGLFGWSATARVVERAQFDAVHDRLVADAANREWLRQTNPHAFEEIVRRLLEADARGLWAADARRRDELQAAVLEIEGDLEDAMGESGIGEHQGGAVDIRTRDAVKEWRYAFTVK
ncbi:cobaltochelatase subunit CobN [Propionivibrio sp.]|uniref:cobaltochelatase subunit CobN n=1 Tax=Propionivibrio sp. TaxID=2212460 RepID=UPI0039E2ED1C